MQRIRKSSNEAVQKAIDELDGYRARVAQIARLKDKREELQNNYTALRTIDYGKLRVQGGAPKDYMVETAVEWADCDMEIDRLIAENEKQLLTIERKLRKLSSIEQTVLFKYYIEYRSLVEIQLLTKYSDAGVRKVKHQALLKYAKLV